MQNPVFVVGDRRYPVSRLDDQSPVGVLPVVGVLGELTPQSADGGVRVARIADLDTMNEEHSNGRIHIFTPVVL